jgi:hypothetical protein
MFLELFLHGDKEWCDDSSQFQLMQFVIAKKYYIFILQCLTVQKYLILCIQM